MIVDLRRPVFTLWTSSWAKSLFRISRRQQRSGPKNIADLPRRSLTPHVAHLGKLPSDTALKVARQGGRAVSSFVIRAQWPLSCPHMERPWLCADLTMSRPSCAPRARSAHSWNNTRNALIPNRKSEMLHECTMASLSHLSDVQTQKCPPTNGSPDAIWPSGLASPLGPTRPCFP